MYQKYLLYEVVDFLADEDFKSWVVEGKRNDALSKHWEEVVRYLPGKRDAMRLAEDEIKKLLLSDDGSSEHQRAAIWQAIERETAAGAPARSKARIFAYMGGGYWTAASFLLLCSLALAVWQYNKADWEEIATGHGNIRKVMLPDSSEIYLGANSGVRFARTWQPGKSREVWLKGNGFLNVKHLNRDPARVEKHHQFVVHTPNGLDIRVLGTSFEVKNKEKEVEVDLVSGSVELSAGGDLRRMSPGEQVVFGADRQFRLQEGLSGLKVDWEMREMYFRNASLMEAVGRISQLFGVDIIIRNPGLYDRRLEGSIPCDSPEGALLALRDILDITVYRQDGVFYIQ